MNEKTLEINQSINEIIKSMKLTSFMLRLVCALESKNKGIALLSESLAVSKLGKLHLILSAGFGTNDLRGYTYT
jgi:hypothetical protein